MTMTRQEVWGRVLMAMIQEKKRLSDFGGVPYGGIGLCNALSQATLNDPLVYSREHTRLKAKMPATAPTATSYVYDGYWWPRDHAGYNERIRVCKELYQEDSVYQQVHNQAELMAQQESPVRPLKVGDQVKMKSGPNAYGKAKLTVLRIHEAGIEVVYSSGGHAGLKDVRYVHYEDLALPEPPKAKAGVLYRNDLGGDISGRYFGRPNGLVFDMYSGVERAYDSATMIEVG